MPRFDLNFSETGFTYDENQLTTKWDSNSGVQKLNDGLFLNGIQSSSDDNKTIDNWTIVEYNGSGTIKTNPEVVQYIYAFSKYPVIEDTRDSMSMKFDESHYKTNTQLIAEINWLHYNGYPQRAQCFPKVGDLIMFKGVGVPLNIHELYGDLVNKTCEDGRRYPDSTCEAMFVLESVTYSGDNQQLPLLDLKIRCLWKSDECPTFTVGQLLT